MGGPFGKYDLNFCFSALNFPKNRVTTPLRKTESGFGIPPENNPLMSNFLIHIEMKKLILALAILASSSLFISCTADDATDEANTTSLQADDSGGNNAIIITKPPPPPVNPGP